MMENKKIKLILPNLFTCANIVLGFLAITYCLEQMYVVASWMIIVSLCFDGLDGKIARLTKTHTEFGIELDSLADIIVFGISPAILMFESFLHRFESLGVVIATIYVICGALRLARFNVFTEDNDKKENFSGLPIPAAAAIIATTFIFFDKIRSIDEFNPYLNAFFNLADGETIPTGFIVIILGTALLMVSKIEYRTFHHFIFDTENKFRMVVSLLFIVGFFIFPSLFSLPIMMIYVLSGIYRWIKLNILREKIEDMETNVE